MESTERILCPIPFPSPVGTTMWREGEFGRLVFSHGEHGENTLSTMCSMCSMWF